MAELIYGTRNIEPPYLVRKYGVTEEAFDRLTDEDTKADLLDGVFIMHSPASVRHERIFMFLSFLMNGSVESRGIGMVAGSRLTMHLASCRKFEPDLLFVRREHLSLLNETELEGPADMVVEILSESTREYDLQEKREVYRAGGIEEIWFVDDEQRQMIVDRKEEGGYKEEVTHEGKVVSQVIEGFWVQAEWFWEERLPNPVACLRAILETDRPTVF